MSRLLLGSVSEAVVRLAPCPVLTVPAGFTQSPDVAAGTEAGAWPSHHCIVCATEVDELICEGCRARIRGEALERKLGAERMGRRGTSV